MAECTRYEGFETLARRAILYDDGCGVLLVSPLSDDGPFQCSDTDFVGLPSSTLLAMSFLNGAVSANYFGGAPPVDCDDLTMRATCPDHPGLETMFREAVLMGKGKNTVINFLETPFEVPCLDCDDAKVPLLTRIMSSFVRGADGETYILLVTAQDAGPVPVTCEDAGNITLETILSSALVPLPGDCGLWGWRATEP